MNSFSTFSTSLLMSLFFVTLFTTINGSIFQNPRISVNITNVLKSHDQLTVHCKSGDDDLGIHQMPFLGGYAFSFRPNFWGSTLFYCTFQWSGFSHYFDIYKDHRDREQCNNTLCLWIVGEQGICMFNYKAKRYDICYTWLPK